MLKKLLKILGILIVICMLLIAVGFIRSNGEIVISTLDIASEKISDERTICVLGDLHSKHFSSLVQKVQDENPDIILLAGDIFDEADTDLTETFETIQDLAGICDVYYALGNHELKIAKMDPEFIGRLEHTGVTIIEQTYFDIDDDIRIGGLYAYPFGCDEGGYNTADSAPADVQEFMRDFTDTERFQIFVAHRPDSFCFSDASEVYTIDLVVSSHIHGGQVVIPFVGGLYGGDQGWFPKYVHGYYKKNNINWLITSGLSSGKKKLPRFNNPPEIYVIRLQPQKQ